VATSLAGFMLFYTTLAVVDVMLLCKYIRLGANPSAAVGQH
jgi:cytochrome bd-type quinol oxidase subunit 1